MSDQKFTVSLPVEIYDALKEIADKRDTSIREIMRQCLKFGLTAIRISEDPNAEIIFRERIQSGEKDGKPIYEIRDSRVMLL
jgi:hypothetical protein